MTSIVVPLVKMKLAARSLKFERAAELRGELSHLKKLLPAGPKK